MNNIIKALMEGRPTTRRRINYGGLVCSGCGKVFVSEGQFARHSKLFCVIRGKDAVEDEEDGGV